MTRQEEQALVRLAASGDRQATAKLIAVHQASLYAFMLRMSGRPDVAEDIVQDAFVRVLKNLDRFDPRFRFSTWLFTIAKRLYMNVQQKYKPVFDTEIVRSWQGDDDQPAGPAMQQETRRNARSAIEYGLDELNEKQREIVLLFHQQQWPIARIAEHLEMPEGTVKSHLHRARHRMRRAISAHRKHGQAVAEVWR
ncbi:MAG: sigma-70 family RNA polymerase sigma factor [Phycisphaerales bacterium]|nr:sigma-70 family RNA polymerase sigma factor [Phycisphaerales bacterium]